jgi:hypothetical protein
MPHPNLNRTMNLPRRLLTSVEAGKPLPSAEGCYLNDLADGAVVEIETQYHHYRLIKRAATRVRISGHPTFCPEPVEVEIEGSTVILSPLIPIPGFIGSGMYLILKHPLFGTITTSRIREIHKLG